jgi:hypothetical protein
MLACECPNLTSDPLHSDASLIERVSRLETELGLPNASLASSAEVKQLREALLDSERQRARLAYRVEHLVRAYSALTAVTSPRRECPTQSLSSS